MALSLAQNGIPFRIIEKATTYHTGSRGFGLQVIIELQSFSTIFR